MRHVALPVVEQALRAASQTHALEIGDGAVEASATIFQKLFPDRPAVVVADRQTMRAAGETVMNVFRAASQPMREPFIFSDPDLYAETRFVTQLESDLRTHSAIPVAVGSGTINDLTKLAAHRANRSYMCVATAASMDGYTAFGASITDAGAKQTFDCPAPVAVIADLNIIAQAPAEMSAWGYADLFAKVTAGADWLVADALGIEPIDDVPWNIVQGPLGDALSDPAGVRAHDRNALGRLMEGLMLGGFAMQAHRSSRPASGAEHPFSHLWDMQHHVGANGRALSHGLKVGIGTLAVIALFEALLGQPLETRDIDRCCAAWPDRATWIARAHAQFGDNEELRAVAEREIAAKAIDANELRRQLTLLRKIWPELRESLRAQLIPFEKAAMMLAAAGAATRPERIGISRERLRASYLQAYFIRRRVTVLDVAVRTGTLDSLLEEVFRSSGPLG
ncbi:MAG TPA: sn-glycerol-1-phosphate dehydrogenase [Chthoniobacteraceae bacterium]|nr:sn-glycerol-1-phosphate dehydrogenase [Chthoniobacteraceae bacterium]